MGGKKPDNDKIRGLNGNTGEQPEIFGRSRSREEIRAELKAQKAQKREEAKRQLKAERERRRAGQASEQSRRDRWITIGVLGLILVVCGGLLAWQIGSDMKDEKFQKSETNTAEFVDESAQPELSEDGLTATVNRVYYTKGGYLCVQMTLGNGLDKPQHMSSLLVKLSNSDSGAQIASGYTAKISEKYVVPEQGYNTYIFYISPEYVSVTDDPLDSLTYEITCEGYLGEETSDTSGN